MDILFYLVVGFFWFVVWGAITYAVAKARGHEPAPWFFFGGLIFIVALPLALLLPPHGHDRNAPARTCPYCGTRMPTSERRCPKCKRGQPDFGTASVGSWEKTVAGGDEVEKWSRGNSPKNDG